MDKIAAEKVIKFCTEIQICPDKRVAFIKGVLYGLGFANDEKREPNWLILKKLIEQGDDPINWLDIEKSVFNTHKKVWTEQVGLWQSLTHEDSIML